MCSQTSPPRLSFSHDLSELQPMKHHVPGRRDNDEMSLMMMMDSNNNNSEFEFSISRSSQEFESSSADELFSNGVILPMQIQNQNKPITTKKHTRLPPRPCPSSTLDKTIKEPCNSMSFWGFGRSKSLNCSDTKKSLNFSSSSLLPRSNSTGSVKNPKRSTSYGGSSSSSSVLYYPVQKSGSGKGYGGGAYYGNGLRVSPVLNVPTPYIPKGTSNFFSFGSILRVGKAKKSKN